MFTHRKGCERKTVPGLCPRCRSKIFYFSCTCGSRVFFDELGGDWPRHDCFDYDSGIVIPAPLPLPLSWYRNRFENGSKPAPKLKSMKSKKSKEKYKSVMERLYGSSMKAQLGVIVTQLEIYLRIQGVVSSIAPFSDPSAARMMNFTHEEWKLLMASYNHVALYVVSIAPNENSEGECKERDCELNS